MRKIIIAFICVVLSSCFAFDSADMHVVGDIYVVDIDGNFTLGREVSVYLYNCLIPKEVYAVWNNDSIVVVKHHPEIDTWDVNKDSTDYYMVLIDKEADERGCYNDSVIGPLNKKQLKLQAKEVGIKGTIKFRPVKFW